MYPKTWIVSSNSDKWYWCKAVMYSRESGHQARPRPKYFTYNKGYIVSGLHYKTSNTQDHGKVSFYIMAYKGNFAYVKCEGLCYHNHCTQSNNQTWSDYLWITQIIIMSPLHTTSAWHQL